MSKSAKVVLGPIAQSLFIEQVPYAVQTRLLHEFGTQASKFSLADRSGFLQPIEFFDFICGTKANHAPKFFSCLARSLSSALRHASSLKNQVGKHADIGSYNQCYYPNGLRPAGNIVSSKKVSSNRYEKPEPHDEDEYREGVHQEISKGEAFLKEEYFRPPVTLCSSTLLQGVHYSLW